jgi:hypothetical protein
MLIASSMLAVYYLNSVDTRTKIKELEDALEAERLYESE